tara:strand:+ start:2274 stop:3599 length:1326 start_codon:yes stop_codon:yes gene_type:complete
MKIWEDFLRDTTKHIPSNLECEIKMMNSKSSLTRFANSHIHQNVEEETSDIYLTLHKDKRTITLTSNLTSIDNPKNFVGKALAEVSNNPLDNNWAGMPDTSLAYDGYKNIEEETPHARSEKVKDFIESGKEFNSAGYCSTSVDNYFVWNTNGLTSSDTSTSAFIDGIHRTDTSAGSSHRGAKKLNNIDAVMAGEEAALLAKDSQNPVDIDPGKYEVVLGNEAVSTILVFLAVYGFNAKNKIDGMSPINIDENQFDKHITLYDDPFRDDSIGFKIDASGAAKKKLNVINEGISNSYFHTRRTAKELKQENTFHELYGWGDSFGGIGTNLYLESGNKSKEEMIKEVKKGIYINEFWYCRVLDPITQVVTGLNRNGSFLIENGKITQPVGRLRFTQSFISALGIGNVLSVGNSTRYADSEFGEGILNVPMLHLKEFSFTGGASG